METGKTLSIVAAAALAVAALSGCTAGEAEPSLSATVAPSAAAEAPSATPTPEPTPTVDAADPASWVIDFTAIGPLTLGQSIPEATAALSAYAAEPEPSCPPLTLIDLGDSAPSIWLADDPLQQLVLIADDPSEVIEVSPRTAEGVGIGSSIDAVTLAYPDAQVSQENASTVYSVGDGAHWINFTVTDAVVDSIVVRDVPAVQSEYCG